MKDFLQEKFTLIVQHFGNILHKFEYGGIKTKF